MNKYCCEDFQWRYTCDPGMGLNIRAAELHDSQRSTGFFLTEGYKIGDKNVKTASIVFCPNCGENLKSFYQGHKEVPNSKVEDFLGLDL